MSVLGGRLGAYRGAFNSGDLDRLTAAVARNVTFAPGAPGADEAVAARLVAERLMKLFNRLGRFSDSEMMAASAIW
jgi:cytochrome b pre-mRNA-processing protein 3